MSLMVVDIESGTTRYEDGDFPPLTADAVRQVRNQLLASCDWTQTPDATVDQEAWRAYRQSLRDITKQLTFPHSVVWPIPPG